MPDGNRVEVECPHGLKVKAELEWLDHPVLLRATVRDLMLACPACRCEASSWIENPGA
jgi:hypothetical protein